MLPLRVLVSLSTLSFATSSALVDARLVIGPDGDGMGAPLTGIVFLDVGHDGLLDVAGRTSNSAFRIEEDGTTTTLLAGGPGGPINWLMDVAPRPRSA